MNIVTKFILFSILLFGLAGCTNVSKTWGNWFVDDEEMSAEELTERDLDEFGDEFDDEFDDEFGEGFDEGFEEFTEEEYYEDDDGYEEEEYVEEYVVEEETQRRTQPRMDESIEDDYGDSPSAQPAMERSSLRKTNIYFDYKSVVVPVYSLNLLELQARALLANRSLTASLAGFTDTVASSAYNKKLALRRAQAVAHVLVQMGVSPSQLIIESYGEERPVDGGSGAMSSALSRRVEVTLNQ